MPRIRLLHELADRQHGLVRQDQARELGFDRWAIQGLLARGEFERLSAIVLRQRGSPRSTPQEHLGAVLDSEGVAVVTDLSAAAIWGVPGFSPVRPVEVTRLGDRRGRPPRLGVVKPVRFVTEEHVTAVDGVPVLTLPVTLYRLAAIVAPARFERVADTICGRSPQILDALHELLPTLARRGRNGITVMRGFLEERPPGHRGPHSALEARLNQILTRAGLPPFDAQVDVGGHSWIGRVDFRDPALPLIVEANSRSYHSSHLDRLNDESRYEALRRAGFEVVAVDEADIWHRPWCVVDQVRTARNRLQPPHPRSSVGQSGA